MRTCKYCGCDISHLRANATICGSRECTNAYKRDLKHKKKEPRYCEVCGKSIDDLPGQRKICLDPECIAEQKRRKYAATKKEKICKKCGKIFLGTVKQTCCEECRNNKDHSSGFEVIQQTIVCEKCGKVLKVVEKKKTGGVKDTLAEGVCEECKEKTRLESSKRMKEDNPMFDMDTRVKVSMTKSAKMGGKILTEEETRDKLIKRDLYVPVPKEVKEKPKEKPKKEKVKRIPRKKETLEETSLRMRLHNPMFNPETRAKVSATFKRKIASGEIVYKKGPEHHLWKGNRTFNKAVRIELRNWVKQKFEEVSYTCQRCGKTHTELQVHHLEPLRDIIQKFLDKHNYTIEYVNSIEGTEEYFSLIKEIVQYHEDNMQIGLVVCPECHNEIDSYYKRKTYENKENNKD